jgi:ATP-binding cassette subfamily B protein
VTGSRSHFRTAGAAVALGGRAAGGRAAIVLVLTVLSSVTPALAAWCTKVVIDELTGRGSADPARLMTLVAAAAGIGAVGVVISYASGFLSLRMQNLITLYVQHSLYERIDRFIGLRQFENPLFADRLRLAEDAAKSAPAVLALFAVTSVRTTVSVVSFAGVLLAIWPPMALLLAIVAIAATVAQVTLARRQARIAQATMATQRRQLMYQQLLTDLRAAKEIRLFGLGGLFQSRMMDALRDATGAELGMQRRSSVVQSGMALLGSVATAAGSVVVVYRAAQGELTAGDLMLFIAAATAVQAAVFSLVGQLQIAVHSTRLFTNYLDVIEAPADLIDGSSSPAPLTEKIELTDVWFRYDADGPWVLQGVNLVIPAGHAIGLVGLNGAGKSTLVKLLCRMYDVDRGRITWDGTDIRALTVAELRRRLGATFQDFQTYEMTVADNIGIGDLDRMGDRPEIEHAAALAGIDGAIQGLPRHYDTMLSRLFFADGSGDSGVELSGGQNQRLALARALMRNDADLLILDEPSSGLDAEAEHALHETMRQHRAGRTSLLISHRLGALRDADMIAVLADGVIAEQGTHDELMARGGAYADLFSLQALNYQDDRVLSGGSDLPEGLEFQISVPIGGGS